MGSCTAAEVCSSKLDISCGADISSNTAAVAGGGLFVGEAVNTHLEMLAECAVQTVRNNSAAFGDPNLFYVSTVCQPGQVSKGGWCDVCPVNMYSFDPRAGKCEICRDHAVCPGGALLLPVAGWWHSTNNSTQVHACPNPNACNHTVSALHAHAHIDWQCAAGYTGPVCGSCQPGYGLTTPFKCGRCMSFEKTMTLYGVSLICLIAFLCYLSQATLRDNQHVPAVPKVSDTLKTLVLYINYVLLLSSTRVDWPKSLSALYTAFAWFMSSASGEVLSLDCILPEGGLLPRAIKRQLVYLLLPAFVTACVLLLFVGSWALPRASCCCGRFRRRAFSAAVTAKVPTTVLVGVYLFFPSLVRVALAVFACFKVDEAGREPYPDYAIATAPYGYWVQDMHQACFQGWHLPWSLALGLPSILACCIGMTAGLFVWLAHNKSRLGDPEFQMHYGFLYAGFRPECYWWEALVAARTVLLVCIAVFSSVVGPFYGMVMYVVVFHVSLVLQLCFRPFAFSKLHWLQLAALGCLNLTACVALTFCVEGSNDGSMLPAVAALQRYKEVAGALLLAMHVAFVCLCLYMIAADVPLQRVCACFVTAWHHMCGNICRLGRCCTDVCSCTCAKPTAQAVAPLNSSLCTAPEHFRLQQLSAAAALDGKGSLDDALRGQQPVGCKEPLGKGPSHEQAWDLHS